MYPTVQAFVSDWKRESGITQRCLDNLTDASLAQRVSPKDRALGELAWHIVTVIPMMASAAGLGLNSPGDPKSVPSSARAIADAYRQVSAALAEAAQRDLTDATLTERRAMFGMELPVAQILHTLVRHEIHHRGQLSVLMRQAGLQVPDIYGPARRD
ncbi:MAG: DinB family protein [Thermoflavifilum sp.]|nr:DinB family protein [Thermoflavifilum sp.]MCL6514525.1 DinB family protein [Alicyclobacillus sp.]